MYDKKRMEALKKKREASEQIILNRYNSEGVEKEVVTTTEDSAKPENTEPKVEDSQANVAEEQKVKDEVVKTKDEDTKKDKSADAVVDAVKEPDLAKELKASEHKFDVLYGKYNAQQTRQQAQIQEQQAEVEKLSKLIVDLKSKSVEEVPEPVKEPKPEEFRISKADATKYVTADDIETFGQPTIDLAVKVASSIVEDTLKKYNDTLLSGVNSKFAEYDKKLVPLTTEIDNVKNAQVKTVQETFEDKMRESIQDYDFHSKDQAFIDWLETPDEHRSIWTKRNFIDVAYEQSNVSEAVKIFDEYFKTIDLSENSGKQINKTVVIEKPEDSAKSTDKKSVFIKDGFLVYEDGAPVPAPKAVVNANVVQTSNIPLNLISPAKSAAGDINQGIENEEPLVHSSELKDMVMRISKDPGSVSDADFKKLKDKTDKARKDGRLIT